MKKSAEPADKTGRAIVYQPTWAFISSESSSPTSASSSVPSSTVAPSDQKRPAEATKPPAESLQLNPETSLVMPSIEENDDNHKHMTELRLWIMRTCFASSEAWCVIKKLGELLRTDTMDTFADRHDVPVSVELAGTLRDDATRLMGLSGFASSRSERAIELVFQHVERAQRIGETFIIAELASYRDLITAEEAGREEPVRRFGVLQSDLCAQRAAVYCLVVTFEWNVHTEWGRGGICGFIAQAGETGEGGPAKSVLTSVANSAGKRERE